MSNVVEAIVVVAIGPFCYNVYLFTVVVAAVPKATILSRLGKI